MTLFEKLKSGQTVHVQAQSSGKRFSIEPVYWEGMILAYTVLEDGMIVPGYKGLMLGDGTVRDWCNNLIEVAPEKEQNIEAVS
jgi:hypothetical protein